MCTCVCVCAPNPKSIKKAIQNGSAWSPHRSQTISKSIQTRSRTPQSNLGRFGAPQGRSRDSLDTSRGTPRTLPGTLGGSPSTPGCSRNALGRSQDASDSVRSLFILTFAHAPVSATISGRFVEISTSCSGRPTWVSHAFLQVETHIAHFALHGRACSGNA